MADGEVHISEPVTKIARNCGYCRDNVVQAAFCGQCSDAFHPSCLKRHQKYCNKTNFVEEESRAEESEVRTEFQMTEELDALRTEITLLRQLVKEQNEKNSILWENNSLLREKIIHLEQINKDSHSAIYRGEGKVSPLNKKMAKNHNKPLNATTTLETTSQMREVSTVKLFNEVAKQKNSDKLKNMQMTQKDIMNKIINLDPSKEQKGSDFQIKGNPTGASSTQKEEEDKNDFKLVRSRRRRSTTIQGAAQGAELPLKGIPSYGYLHVYCLDPGTTEDELVSYLTNKNIKYPSCTKLVAKHPEI